MSNASKSIQLPQPQPAIVKRKKRRHENDENVYVAHEESVLLSKRLKIQVTKQNCEGVSNNCTKMKKHPSFSEATVHESPKIWDIFERFQEFSRRKILNRTASGLTNPSDENVTRDILQTNSALTGSNDIHKDISTNQTKNEAALKTNIALVEDNGEPSIGGDRKRRCVEVTDYEGELQGDGNREAQAPCAFKPKCLNFDDIED